MPSRSCSGPRRNNSGDYQSGGPATALTDVSSGQFGMDRTVGEQRIGHEGALVNGRVADLTGSIGATTKSFKRAIDVVQR